jgi:GntR family transcriptional regulator
MRIVISNASESPIYAQIARQIRAQIVDGTLSEGEALPSIRHLARELEISVITTKRAYDDLEREGLIDSVAGKGTFVAVHNKEFLKERTLKSIEDRLARVVHEAQLYGIERTDVETILDLLWKEEA